ncbi:MAG: polysulfide reductase NrfD, partial [Chloroflexi bacterium]|nr:polysulfide reductase NrfD [Chloroflexota bacterium]
MQFSTVAARESVRMLVSGSLAMPFVLGVTAIGLVIPLILTALALAGWLGSGASTVIALAGLLMLVGGFLFRRCMLKAGVYAPII